jgi:membrane protein
VVQSLAAIEPLGSIIVAISRTVPYLLICGAFAFFYAFITNTRVRPSAALAGGIFAGVLWYATGMIFATFVASSSNYSGVYSGFAGAALFIIWLQIGWLVILLGAQVACYWQHPYLLNLRDGTGDLLGCRCESLALEIMTLIGQAYYHNQPLWTSQTLETRYGGIPAATISGIVQNLLRRKFILATNDDPPLYLPAHDIGTIDLAAVTKAVRAEDEFVSRLPAVDTVMRQIDEAITHTLQGKTLRDLISGNSVTEPLSRQKSFKSGANESNESYAGE